MIARIFQVFYRLRIHLVFQYGSRYGHDWEHSASLSNMKFFCIEAKFTLAELWRIGQILDEIYTFIWEDSMKSLGLLWSSG